MRKIIATAAILAAASFAAPAMAATDSDSMQVTATVVNNCVVTASPMAFGTLTTLGTANIDSSATISLACTPNAVYDVAMDLGLQGVSGQRYLVHDTDGTQSIPYGVYTNAGRSNVWTSGVGQTVVGTATGGTATLTAYGRIPSSASAVIAGSYADTVTVIVTF